MARKTGSPGMDSPFSALFVCSIQPTGRKTGKGNIMGDSNSNTNQNQNDNPTSGQGTGEKTFTQEDVNRIVQERLAKEKARNGGEADFAKREQELARRELHMTARELLSEKGLPVQLFVFRILIVFWINFSLNIDLNLKPIYCFNNFMAQMVSCGNTLFTRNVYKCLLRALIMFSD